jgi:hypothetical protein
VFPPPEVLYQIGYAAAVSAAVLLVTWPWRERGWPVPVALGLGVATCSVAAIGLPDPWPVARADRMLHFALAGAILGTVEAVAGMPRIARWATRGGICLGSAWTFLLPADSPWKVAAVAAAGFLAWSAFGWRAARAEGYGTPLVAAVVAGAGALALAFGHSGFLAQLAGALAAGAGLLVAYGLLWPGLSFGRGGVTAFALVALPLWLCGWRLADLPLESAALLAVAPVATQRRGWLGALAALLAAGFAVYLAWHANPDTVDPALGY